MPSLRVSFARIGVFTLVLLAAGAIVYVALKATDDSSRQSGSRMPESTRTGSASDFGAAEANCEVTKAAVGRPPIGTHPEPGWITEDGLWVSFGEKTTIFASRSDGAPPGTIAATPGPGGSIRAKIPWLRERRAFGTLQVRGERRPGGESLTRAFYDDHLGPTSQVVPGAIVFPRQGCWLITASSGQATLRAVLWVVRSDQA